MKQVIEEKDTEINKINIEIDQFEKKFEKRIESLEEIVNTFQKELENLKKENEALRNAKIVETNEKNSLSESENYVAKEITEFDGVDDDTATCENEHVCDKCGFVGKTEAGLKIHNTAKHRGFRKVTRKNIEK